MQVEITRDELFTLIANEADGLVTVIRDNAKIGNSMKIDDKVDDRLRRLHELSVHLMVTRAPKTQ